MSAASGPPEWYEGGQGSSLVLLHGFGGTWRMWKPLLPLLEPHHRVIAPTLPGHTGGVALARRASPVSIAEALAVLKHLDDPSAAVDEAVLAGMITETGRVVWAVARAESFMLLVTVQAADQCKRPQRRTIPWCPRAFRSLAPQSASVPT